MQGLSALIQSCKEFQAHAALCVESMVTWKALVPSRDPSNAALIAHMSLYWPRRSTVRIPQKQCAQSSTRNPQATEASRAKRQCCGACVLMVSKTAPRSGGLKLDDDRVESLQNRRARAGLHPTRTNVPANLRAIGGARCSARCSHGR
jgi:hypothetical protein